MSMRIGSTRSRVILLGTAAVMAASGTAVASAGTSQPSAGTNLLPTVTRTVSKIVSDTGKVAQSVNYTVNVKPQARTSSTDSYGNPLEGLSLQGLPSLPGAGAALPFETGNNPGLDNEPS